MPSLCAYILLCAFLLALRACVSAPALSQAGVPSAVNATDRLVQACCPTCAA